MRRIIQASASAILLVSLFTVTMRADGPEGRFTTDLSEGWTIEVIAGTESSVPPQTRVPIQIGREWEATLGERFDGKASYRCKLAKPLPRDTFHQWWLEVEGAATAAVVKIDGVEVARHLGGWTPFRIDITPWVAKQSDSYQPEIEIELDELVGHNTQGFLPIVVPHFGGIWKSVQIVGRKHEAYIDDMSLRVGGHRGQDQLELDVPISLPTKETMEKYQVEFRLLNGTASEKQWQPLKWQPSTSAAQQSGSTIRTASLSYVPVEIKRWSPVSPFLYQIEFRLLELESRQVLDSVATRAAIRHVRTDGRKLLLNGETIAVRGLLNWGYAPPRLSPTNDPQWMENELREAKSRGFNLMKICLWVPPKRYLELADEMGMLVWMEYPTWHPDFSEKKLADLKTEFKEFFHYDRNHPSVLVRSLTCETGPGADLKVIRELYDLAHQEVPGSIVEDDSSWIQWNRVSDFYDDHPYGNNHTWRAKLDELDQYIMQRDPKPLLLGEAIAGDTWVTPVELEKAGAAAATVHAPLSAEKLPEYVELLKSTVDTDSLANLLQSSRRYAWLMRKFQIETFRDRFPDQGYVISVIRDFPLASMGLIDRSNQWKWSAAEFDWHRDAMLVLRTPQDRRLFTTGEKVNCEVALVGLPAYQMVKDLRWKWKKVDAEQTSESKRLAVKQDNAGRWLGEIALAMPAVSKPELWRLSVTGTGVGQKYGNQWDLWITPQQSPLTKVIYYHSSIAQWLKPLETSSLKMKPWEGESGAPLVVTRRWDRALWEAALKGARVIMLPDNSTGSLATRDHWFLRGGPMAGREHPFWKIYSRDMLSDIQHFDWAGPVMFDTPLTAAVTPIALLWDNHDLKLYRSHLLAFDCRVGEGRWLASTLGLKDQADASAEELLMSYIRCIEDEASEVRALSAEWIAAIDSEIDSKAVSLAGSRWVFQPDPQQEGVEKKWFDANYDHQAWKPITIDRHWESHGFEGLDGWGWYFTDVEIPDNLKSISGTTTESEPLFIQFTGADDYFELFVDGELVGSGGDRELRQTAFELRRSFELPAKASVDGKITIAVRILDWQGAGGLFRPIYLSNRPIRETAPVLVEAK